VEESDHSVCDDPEPGPQPTGGYLALLTSAEQLLDEVDRALAALDAGAYGVCRVCGGAIGTGALAADPLASVCAAHPVARGAVVPEA
jgi:RNA polymerase-binding transcription factor DksA